MWYQSYNHKSIFIILHIQYLIYDAIDSFFQIFEFAADQFAAGLDWQGNSSR